MLIQERVDGLAKNGGAADARKLPREAQGARDLGRGDFDALGAMRLHIRQLAERIGSPIGNQPAVIDVRNVAAPFGFIHVMRGDEKRDAVTGKLEEKIPKLAARDGIDARGWLVKEQELWLV